MSRWVYFRRWALRSTMDGGLSVLARAGSLHPMAKPERHGIRRIQDERYGTESWQKIDWYVPPADRPGPWPVVVYLHGGGFQALSKDTHWIMGLALARRGYLVAVPDYRLAPAHPYPAGLEDALVAIAHVHKKAHEHGGDASRFVLAGESAGAAFAIASTIAAVDRIEEPHALAFHAEGIRVGAVLVWSGIYQVTDAERDMGNISILVRERLRDIEVNVATTDAARASILCNPIRWFDTDESAPSFPPTYLAVGTKDVVGEDTFRLHRAMKRRGVDAELHVYDNGIHAFHAFVFQEIARQSWRDAFDFLERHLAR